MLWQAYFRIELMCADALRTRRQVLLGNEQQDDKYQNEGDVAEIVFDGAVRSHTGEPFSSRETDTSQSTVFLFFIRRMNRPFYLPYLRAGYLLLENFCLFLHTFLILCTHFFFVGDITFHLQLVSMTAEYQVVFPLGVTFASSHTPALASF